MMQEIQASRSWYNYRTQQYEDFLGMPPTARLPEFISQYPAAQALYAIYCAQGDAPIEALRKVLLAQLPRKEKG